MADIEIRPETETHFQESVNGTWGVLRTANGEVPYLLTSARLPDDEADAESRLTPHLRPVREALPLLGDEDFGLLLQRPLNDYRVTQDLVPYLLRAQDGVPGFFPSILVAALPFDGDTPLQEYAANPVARLRDRNASFEWGNFEEELFGDGFRVSRLVDNHGHHAVPRLAKFDWNPDRIRLIVLDGQHRAMALLAIQREAQDSWPAGTELYRSFYDGSVAPLLNGVDIADIRLPVTIVWFPPVEGVPQHPLRTARKLFVTVNNEARQPGPARLMLLEDSRLVSIFTRSLLEQMRSADTTEQLRVLDGVLYEDDKPGNDRARNRWPAMTDHINLKWMVHSALYSDGVLAFSKPLKREGKPNSQVMRSRLDLPNADFPQPLPEDGEKYADFGIDDVLDSEFPHSWVPTLVRRFRDQWGELLLWPFSTEGPYASHLEALAWLLEGDAWHVGPEGALAREAVASNGLWPVIREQDGDAWRFLDRQRDHFESRRADLFMERPATADERLKVDKSFEEALKTEACQVGLAALVLTLANVLKVAPANRPRFAQLTSHGLRAALMSTNENSGATRRFSLTRWDGTPEMHTLNLLREVSTSDSVHFRYMWLELLRSDPGMERMDQALDEGLFDLEHNALGDSVVAVLSACSRAAQNAYVDKLSKEAADSLMRTANLTQQQAKQQGRTKACQDLTRSLAALIEGFDEDAKTIHDRVFGARGDVDPEVQPDENVEVEAESGDA